MLSWFLHGLAGALIGSFAAMFVIKIQKIITKRAIQEQMQRSGLHKVMIKMMDECNNRITYEDFVSKKTHTIQGTGISDELKVGMEIYAY